MHTHMHTHHIHDRFLFNRRKQRSVNFTLEEVIVVPATQAAFRKFPIPSATLRILASQAPPHLPQKSTVGPSSGNWHQAFASFKVLAASGRSRLLGRWSRLAASTSDTIPKPWTAGVLPLMGY